MTTQAASRAARLPAMSDAVKKARREITTARRRAERARGAAREAEVDLARAVARAPRGGRGPRAKGADYLTVDELAELAGLESRQGVYDLIARAEEGGE
jgi:hypothetical protein